MKKIGILSLLAIIPFALSGCVASIPEEKEFDKTKLLYTYQDYGYNNGFDASNCPAEGAVNILVIPVWFSDSNSYITTSSNRVNVLADLNTAFNGTEADTGWHSLSSFYQAESSSKLKLKATISNWYECGRPMADYSRSTKNTASLVVSASNWYFSTHDDNKQIYDLDEDGYLDAVILVYGAPEYYSLGLKSYSNLWAYTSWLSDTSLCSVTNPGPNVFMWASYDFMYNDTKAALRAGTSYGVGDTRYCNIDAHTYIHEMGHVLGLEDYYDYSDYEYKPGGGFSMQDYNVGSHDPYSMMALGWVDPIIPTESATVTLKPFQTSRDVILLANHDVDSPFDEYMLLELYTPTGLNEFDVKHQYGNSTKGPNANGIRLWHIDARLFYFNNPSRISDKNLTTNPTTNKGKVLHAFSNSYDVDHGSYLAELNKSYLDYNILQLIRDSYSSNYHPTDTLGISSLFRDGSSYAQKQYYRQFVYETKMNDGEELGWRFVINSLNGDGASISLYKTD